MHMDASEALAGHTRIPKKIYIKIHFHIIQLCTQPIYKTMDASKPLPAEGRKETP